MALGHDFQPAELGTPMTTVSSGQIQIVSSGQDIQDTTVLSGGEQIILAGGAANDTVIRACPQLSQMTMAARWTPARKFRAVLS